MSYGYKKRICYHEVDASRKLTFHSLIDLFQDCGSFHGEDCGCSNQFLADQGLAWILSSWQIVTGRMPKLGDWVELTTIPYYFKHFLAYRYFILRSEDGEELARANSVWLLMNMINYKPAKIPQSIVDAYGLDEDLYKDYDFGGRKIDRMGGAKQLEPVIAAPYMIDTNLHVNNQQYVRIAYSYLPENFSWNAFRGEYTKQARLGDALIPEISQNNGVTQIALMNEEGEQFFLGEWTNREPIG